MYKLILLVAAIVIITTQWSAFTEAVDFVTDSILGDLKPNTFVTCDKDNIGRARYALYQLYNNPIERESIKVGDNEYQLWRYEIEKPRKVPLTASIAHARQKR